MKTLKEVAIAKGLDIALDYLDRDIEKNLPKLLEWAERFDVNGNVKTELDAIKKTALVSGSNWNRYVLNMRNTIDYPLSSSFYKFYCLQQYLGDLGLKSERRMTAMPWAILLTLRLPATKLHRLLASEYDSKSSMSFDMLDDIVNREKI